MLNEHLSDNVYQCLMEMLKIIPGWLSQEI